MNHLKLNQKLAYMAARDGGLSDQSAKVVTANFTGESLHKPWLRGWDIKQFSQGIAQWSQIRANRIKAHFGKYPKDMSVTEQVKAFLWECKRFYPKTWKALNSGDLSAKDKMSMLVRDFERPRNPERAVKDRMRFFESLSHVGADDGTGTA